MGWLKCSGIRICYLARCDWHHSPRRPASKSRHQAVRKDSSAHHQTVGPHSTCAMLALVCSLFVVRQQHSTTSNFFLFVNQRDQRILTDKRPLCRRESLQTGWFERKMLKQLPHRLQQHLRARQPVTKRLECNNETVPQSPVDRATRGCHHHRCIAELSG